MVVEELNDIRAIFHKVMQDLKRVAIGIGCLPDATLLGLDGSKYVFYNKVHAVHTASLEVHRYKCSTQDLPRFFVGAGVIGHGSCKCRLVMATDYASDVVGDRLVVVCLLTSRH